MVKSKQTAYRSPRVLFLEMHFERALLTASTGEKFTPQQDYSDGWTEED